MNRRLRRSIAPRSLLRYVSVARMYLAFSDVDQTSFPSSFREQVLKRDGQCLFSGIIPNNDSDALISTWIFPPFLGYTVSMYFCLPPNLRSLIMTSRQLVMSGDKLSDDEFLENKYHTDPDSCDLSDLIIVENALSIRKDLAALFWENSLGVDVDVRVQSFIRYFVISNINFR